MTSTAGPGRGSAGVPGPVLFVRYAFPPNRHGYCGPADSGALFDYGAAGVVDPGLREMAAQFSGAWPYLQLIAGATGIEDPLDARVVAAYWVGNRLLDAVGVRALGDSMEERFRPVTGRQFPMLAEAVLAGGVPHHSYHVFCVYPWVGLLGADRRGAQALTVLDGCRIRWGRVHSMAGDTVVVDCPTLRYDGRRLSIGPPERQTVVRALDGVGLAPELAEGDTVSLHWEWVCDRLDADGLAALRHYTERHLALANERLAHPGALAALG